MFLTDGVAWDGIQLPSLKQLKVRLRSGLLSSSFPCNICRERHPSRGWSPPPRAVGRITLWTQIPHFTDYKGTKFHVFYLGNIFQAEKEEVPGAQGEPHHKVSNLEEPSSKSISAQGDVPPSFLSYKKHPERFYCASGTFSWLLHWCTVRKGSVFCWIYLLYTSRFFLCVSSTPGAWMDFLWQNIWNRQGI